MTDLCNAGVLDSLIYLSLIFCFPVQILSYVIDVFLVASPEMTAAVHWLVV